MFVVVPTDAVLRDVDDLLVRLRSCDHRQHRVRSSIPEHATTLVHAQKCGADPNQGKDDANHEEHLEPRGRLVVALVGSTDGRPLRSHRGGYDL